MTGAGTAPNQGPWPGVSASPGGRSLARTPEGMCGLLTPRTGTERLDLVELAVCVGAGLASSAADC